MKKVVISTAIASAMLVTGAAHGATVKTDCARGADARTIEIIAPGVVGESCDVRYTRGGGANVSVPYHADNADSFCNQKAEEMVQRLTASGFVCAVSAPALRADTSEGGSDYVVEVRRPASTQQVAAADAEIAPASQSVPAADRSAVKAALSDTPASDPIEPSSAVAEAPIENGEALEAQMNQILAQPVVVSASREPAQLIAQQAETTPASSQPSAVGRIVGAAPSTPQPAVTVTQASLAEPDPAAQNAAQPKEVLRTPADVVRATLRAQAAAWNEGDLDGFMSGYWKSDELKFVSGGSITKGWDATLKRYREHYAGGTGLGQLGFEKLDVKLVTEDVAVVTGRFNLVNNGETSSGLFSLVMRRDNGAWRIVHDHTSAD